MIEKILALAHLILMGFIVGFVIGAIVEKRLARKELIEELKKFISLMACPAWDGQWDGQMAINTKDLLYKLKELSEDEE